LIIFSELGDALSEVTMVIQFLHVILKRGALVLQLTHIFIAHMKNRIVSKACVPVVVRNQSILTLRCSQDLHCVKRTGWTEN